MLVSRETYWNAAQVCVIYLTVQTMSKDNSTVSVLKYFTEIYRPYVNNCMEQRPSLEARGAPLLKFHVHFLLLRIPRFVNVFTKPADGHYLAKMFSGHIFQHQRV
jgi:hypothetical protein